jgi:DNA polymerase-3 subunit gamma/tau
MSSYLALARKYRPHSFEEMVGQKEVLSALVNSLDSGKLHHAYLLSGTRGVGKTTLARIFAKAVNCEKGVGSTPCGECRACRAIDEGNFVDLIEIDAASRTKVEDTRSILENVNYKPGAGRYKVYLIDEVHMLSQGSFNALLKTLEEPPEHVKFILATTDPQKIPATVVSRCIQLKLRSLTVEQIETQLKKVLDQEGVSYDDGSVRLIAEAGNGSMRDALSIADQAVALSGDNLKKDGLLSMLGRMDSKLYVDLVRAVHNKNGAELYRILDSIDSFSPNYQSMLDDLISLVHQVCVFSAIGGSGTCIYTYDMNILRDISADISLDVLQLYYQILLNAKRDFIYAPSGRTAMDMVLIRMLAFTDQPSARKKQPNPAGESRRTPSAGDVRSVIRGDHSQNLPGVQSLPGGFPEQVQAASQYSVNPGAVQQPFSDRQNAGAAPAGMSIRPASSAQQSPAVSRRDPPSVSDLVSGKVEKLTIFDNDGGITSGKKNGTEKSSSESSVFPNSGRKAVPDSSETLRLMAEMVREIDPTEIPWDSNFQIIGLNGERRPQPKHSEFLSNLTLLTGDDFKREEPEPPAIMIPSAEEAGGVEKRPDEVSVPSDSGKQVSDTADAPDETLSVRGISEETSLSKVNPQEPVSAGADAGSGVQDSCTGEDSAVGRADTLNVHMDADSGGQPAENAAAVEDAAVTSGAACGGNEESSVYGQTGPEPDSSSYGFSGSSAVPSDDVPQFSGSVPIPDPAVDQSVEPPYDNVPPPDDSQQYGGTVEPVYVPQSHSGDFSGSARTRAGNTVEYRRNNFKPEIRDEFRPEHAVSYVVGKDPWLDILNERISEPFIRLVLMNSAMEQDADGVMTIRIGSADRSVITDAMMDSLSKMLGAKIRFEIDENARVDSPNGKAYVVYNKIKKQQFAKLKESDPFKLLCKNFGCVPDIDNFHLVKKQ